MPYCLDSYGESNLASLEQQWDDLGDDPREILNFLNNSKNNICAKTRQGKFPR